MIDLKQKAKELPTSPGCYLMKNKQGKILYVGKAKSLKNRVTSYFNQSAKSPKTQMMLSHVVDFDFILTATDAESFVLENNLIKEHRPKYNIQLRDDSSYPYVQIDFNHAYPRLQYVRRPKRKQNVQLFGPYPVGSQISEVMKTLTKALRLRDCSDYDFKQRKTPCLLFQMHQCTAPCVELIEHKEYQQDILRANDFFSSQKKAEKVLGFLKTKMHVFAEAEKFEEAALLRDQIYTLEDFLDQNQKQHVEFQDDKAVDVIAFYKGESEVDMAIYLLRNGLLLGQKNFHFLLSDFMEDLKEEYTQFVLQYYQQSEDPLPEAIVLELPLEQRKLLQSSLSLLDHENHGRLLGPRSLYGKLLSTVEKYAFECQRIRLLHQDSVYVGLNKLQELLALKERPKKLECYDIAIWQGHSPTAAQIVSYEGQLDKSAYRHYHLQEREEGNNDFAMMNEVFARRVKHSHLPDLFVVDGGRGQVNAALAALNEQGVDIPVIGIAKAKNYANKEKTQERLIIPNRANPYYLEKCPALFKIIVQMRDEAHRFSRRLHHKQEEKRVFNSWVDEIDGLGEKTKKLILSHLIHSESELKEMTVDKLSKGLGVDYAVATKIHAYFKQKA